MTRNSMEHLGTHPGHQPISRRAFIIAAASACGPAVIWSVAPSLPAKSMALGATKPSETVTIIDYSPEGKKIGKITVSRVIKTDAEWKAQLSPISFEVTRRSGTESPYTGSNWDLHDHGIFRCVCCDIALFSSDTKFESGTGWPSFWQPIALENVAEHTDDTMGMRRTAVSCRLCDAHLGHVFDDGPRPTGLRYCMNSAALRFVKTA